MAEAANLDFLFGLLSFFISDRWPAFLQRSSLTRRYLFLLWNKAGQNALELVV
jgi:hypothetical protein